MRRALAEWGEYAAALCIVSAVLWALWSTWVPVRVVGGSMCPALWPGDIALVGRNARPWVGCIVLAQHPGRGAVLHRVVAIDAERGVTTKGDANCIEDPGEFLSSEIGGVVIRVVPCGALVGRWRGIGELGTMTAQPNSKR